MVEGSGAVTWVEEPGLWMARLVWWKLECCEELRGEFLGVAM